MGTSAKRLGLDVKGDIELELRLRRIEKALSEVSRVSDFAADSVGTTQRSTTIPQVTGLRVVGKTPGAITLAWNSVRISDLRRYELDIAEDLAFTSNKQTFNVAGTEYQFSTIAVGGGGGDTTIYARVRARSVSNVGPYSVTLNTTTGQAQNEDIADGAVTTIKIAPEDPIEFSGLDDEDVGAKLALRGYISGLILSNNADDSARDIDISSGVARDYTNTLSMRLSSVLTKKIDDNWAVGDAQGGLPTTVSLANNTWYFVFLIANTSSVIDAGFDDDPNAVNLLAESGFTYYRRLGAVRTDGSSDIYAFTQFCNDFIWDVPKQDVSLNDPTTSEITHTLDYVPSGYELLANVTISYYNDESTPSGAKIYAYGGGNTTLSAASSSFHDIYAKGDQRGGAVHDRVLTNSSAQIKTRQSYSNAAQYLYIQVHGWVEAREENVA